MHEVTLDWITPDAEEVIVRHARVSADPAKPARPADVLLRYLIQHKHWSPFDQANMAIMVVTTRDIGRQLLRHWTLRPQEFSQRYEDPEVLGKGPVLREARLQDPKNRQASLPSHDTRLLDNWRVYQQEVWNTAVAAYDWAILNGIAKEVARTVLPEGLTRTQLYLNGSIRSWVHFCEVRSKDAGAQDEVARIADQVRGLLHLHLPTVAAAAFGTLL